MYRKGHKTWCCRFSLANAKKTRKGKIGLAPSRRLASNLANLSGKQGKQRRKDKWSDWFFRTSLFEGCSFFPYESGISKPMVCQTYGLHAGRLARKPRKSRKRPKRRRQLRQLKTSSNSVECWINGNHGNHGNDENDGNPGCKPRVPQTTGLEIPRWSSPKWGAPKASHIKASQPHFPHFLRFRVPKGPKIEKIQDLEIFKRDWNFQARRPPDPYFLWGFLKVGIEIFKRDWNFQAGLKVSIEIEFFQSLGPYPKNLLRLFFASKIIFIFWGYFLNPSENTL